MEVLFPPVIANASDFPEVVIKASPAFQLRKLTLFAQPRDLQHVQFTRNGRGAMGIAGQTLQYPDRKNVVLIPAYHCPALVEPFIWLGYEIRFYPLKPDLSVDIDAFNQLLTDEITHCVVIRYFGFALNIQQVIDLSHQHKIRVIEDCAHALFDFMNVEQRGNTGAEAKICSINKLLPSIDGGALYYPPNQLTALHYNSWLEEIKGLLYLTGMIPIINRVRHLFVRAKTPVPAHSSSESQTPPKLNYFAPSDLESAGFRHTEWLLKHSDFTDIIDKRRANFGYLVEKLADSKAGQPLYHDLQGSIPYVVPFLLNDEKYFAALRQQGIQVLRWEEVALSSCQISQDYRKRLVQLPCHQQLSQHELDVIISAVNAVEAE